MPQTGWEVPVLSLVDLVQRNQTHRQQAEQEIRQQRTEFEHQMSKAEESLELASYIQRDQRQELQRLSALVASREKTFKGREAALQQQLADAHQQIANLQQETASSTLQHQAEHESAARLAQDLSATQVQISEQAQQAQEALQAMQALSYEALNLCNSRHTAQLQAMTSRMAKQTKESSLLAASAAADREAAAADAQQAAGKISALQEAAQAQAGELQQGQQALMVQKGHALALQIVIWWERDQARQAEMCHQARMHAAARQTASLQQDITAQAAHSTSWASRCHARTEPRTAITFSQALQAEPCQNATPRPTQSKTIKDCRLGRAAIRYPHISQQGVLN